MEGYLKLFGDNIIDQEGWLKIECSIIKIALMRKSLKMAMQLWVLDKTLTPLPSSIESNIIRVTVLFLNNISLRIH